MGNAFAKVCKVSASILLIAALIGGIVVATEEESFAIFMYFAIGSFVSFLFIYGLGEIVEILCLVNNNAIANKNKTYQLYELVESDIRTKNGEQNDYGKSPNDELLEKLSQKRGLKNYKWTCDFCKSENPNRTISETCMYCGQK